MSLFRFHKSKSIYNETIENFKCLKRLGYVIGQKIGEGAYSKVCIALFTRGDVQKKLACKIINKKRARSELMNKFLPREISIVSMIDHPNIVNVLNILEINNTLYMFMDYCKNGDLLEYLRTHDVWSLGCILFIMLFASMPFDDSNVTKMLRSQQEKSAYFDVCRVWRNSSPALCDLFNNILEPDAAKRCNIAEIASSKWLQEEHCVQILRDL
ncbi:hypothetical protein PPYR_11432 [Photinus pyralis]|uniref:Protein kinase domain-containing protein n=1 Tax=Photinus pyralis TaxID=7054 RepID=A0A5N4AB97_PHOPY|nr:hypothetical protein PPYR_11432 [Photinus pyralis]